MTGTKDLVTMDGVFMDGVFIVNRAQYETLIRRCFIQLTEGCGNSECTNPNCATGSGQTMDQNQAAAKALTLVHKNKKIQICIPQERVSCSSVGSKKCLLNNLPVTPSASGSSSLEDIEDSSYPDLSPSRTEPMETTDSLVTANTQSQSSGSAASSTIIRMHSSTSEETSVLHQPSQPVVQIPSDIEQITASASGSIDTTSEVLSNRSSEFLVVANHMASASSISSSEIVGMDLSPSVPSGPSFSLPEPKDGAFLTTAPLENLEVPGKYRLVSMRCVYTLGWV